MRKLNNITNIIVRES